VLFLALNPPQQSNDNGHCFSGSPSRFYRPLFMSGLMTEDVTKSYGHEFVFGSTSVNYKRSAFGRDAQRQSTTITGSIETLGRLAIPVGCNLFHMTLESNRPDLSVS
jgi:hypothetical protein